MALHYGVVLCSNWEGYFFKCGGKKVNETICYNLFRKSKFKSTIISCMKNSPQKQESAAQFINRFLDWTRNQGSKGILYRGLNDKDWEISSSFYRRLCYSNCIKKDAQAADTYQAYIYGLEDITSSAKQWSDIKGGVPSDLEILADLQYHGVLTGLLAFTRNPLVALWFACQDEQNTKTDGKVVAIDSSDDNLYHVITSKNMNQKLNDLFNGNQLWKWNILRSNNRIAVQHLEFIFGKYSIEANDTFFISSDIKKTILGELERYDITGRHLFPDLRGYVRRYGTI